MNYLVTYIVDDRKFTIPIAESINKHHICILMIWVTGWLFLLLIYIQLYKVGIKDTRDINTTITIELLNF